MDRTPIPSPAARRVWGSPDAILLVFAGSAAEFAAIKAVDWLFFTGRLPGDPVGRFFETVGFAQRVFFGEREEADAAISAMNRVHRNVEGARGVEIPQWAYRDVLFMLVDYAEKAHEVVFGPMSEDDKAACRIIRTRRWRSGCRRWARTSRRAVRGGEGTSHPAGPVG